MADLSQHVNYSGNYSGLLDNFYVTVAVAAVCLAGYELEIHIPRRRGRDGTYRRVVVRIYHASQKAYRRWKSGGSANEKELEERPSLERLIKGRESPDLREARKRLGDREDWEFGYIHQPKAWALNAGPPVPRWPLAWVWSALGVRERDMPETCGLDLTLHARFLRGCFFYTLLQAIIIMPILLPLHIIYSLDTVSSTSMLRAGASSLVESSGSKWLWVHAILIWWVSITWSITVLWITWGGVAYRRREIKRLARRVEESRKAKVLASGNEDGIAEDDRWTVRDDCEGIKRFRTLMITNVPPDMRDEDSLRRYFDFYIHRHRARTSPGPLPPRFANQDTGGKIPQILSPVLHPGKIIRKRNGAKADPEVVAKGANDANADGSEDGEDGVEVEAEEEDDSPFETEIDEIVLVRKLGALASLRDRRMKVLKQLELAHVQLAQRVLKAVRNHKAKLQKQGGRAENATVTGQDVEKAQTTTPAGILLKKDRLDKLTAALGSFVDDEPNQRGEGKQTVWDVLHSLPRELLDPYQSLTHLKVTSVFRDQNAPLIDYLTTKLAYLTALLDDARSQPLSTYSTASTAFVTFRDARTARLALKILDSHPKRSLACNAVPAPEWTDLLWNRLGKSTYRSEFVRNWVVFLAVWAFTLIWIFPVSLFCALTTLTNLGGFIPPLKSWLDQNPKASAAISSLAPVFLVALLTIAICPILLAIANKGETIVTRLGIHNSVLERFWKFLMVNGVVFFAIGQTAIEAYLTAFQTRDFDPLPIVASAFPTAAPYFASYILLQVAIQPCFELFRFGLPAIVYVFGTRVAKTPRSRFNNTEHPTFSHFSQLPYQLLAGAIMHLFMLLNPLVIPFTLVYYGACYLVWKRQFTYVYGRLYENNGRRSCVRILRYSLDALALGQFVLFAFFILNKAKGHAIGTGILFFFTLVEKLIITRALKRRFDNLEVEEADILCPVVPRDHDQATRVDSSIDGDQDFEKDDSRNRSSSTNEPFMTRLQLFIDKWVYASSHRHTPVGYRKPIPFDHLFFARLDRLINFPLEPTTDEKKHGHAHLVSDPVHDSELIHSPDHAISHVPAHDIVTPHHPHRPWEDIPPYQRSRGYNDQPAYTDDYDDFIWLPRDPLSTIDLDDTVELRLALTTSAGGSGKFGSWPPEEETVIEEPAIKHSVVITEPDDTEEIVIHPASPDGPVSDQELSPAAPSMRRLIDPIDPPRSPTSDTSSPIDLPPEIGTEADDNPATQLFRTIRMRQTLSRAFRRPPIPTRPSGDAITLRTLSITSSSSQALSPAAHSAPPILPTPVQESPQAESTLAEVLPSPSAGPSTSTSTSIPFPIPIPTPATPVRTGSQISFVPIARTSSARRPIPQTQHSNTSIHRAASLAVHSPSIRSASGFSARGFNRDRSISGASATQQALLRGVMEEERLALQNADLEEKQDQAKEEEALRKEKARSGTLAEGNITGSVRRRASRLDTVSTTSDGVGRKAGTAGGLGGDLRNRRRSRGMSGASGLSGLSGAASPRVLPTSPEGNETGSSLIISSRSREQLDRGKSRDDTPLRTV